jgi:hypothetical protein
LRSGLAGWGGDIGQASQPVQRGFFSDAHLSDAPLFGWGACDSAGLVMATSLLCLKFLQKGNQLVAAGFLVFALGESVILSGTAAGVAGSVPAFAAGTAL